MRNRVALPSPAPTSRYFGCHGNPTSPSKRESGVRSERIITTVVTGVCSVRPRVWRLRRSATVLPGGPHRGKGMAMTRTPLAGALAGIIGDVAQEEGPLPRITRRGFLLGAAATAAAVAIGPLPARAAAPRIVVVGAGLAG